MSITTINAYAVTHRAGKAEPFSYQRRIGSDEVLVRVTHCSVARADIQWIGNDWGDARFPLVPGHEIVGVVEETGPTATDLVIGDRVGIGSQQYACSSCEFCRSGSEQLCPQQKVIGVDCYGGWADHIGIDGRFAFKLPPTLDSAPSSPLLSSGLTVYSAIVRAGLSDRSDVAVLGVGGLGHLAIQFLRELGHRVSAFSHSPEKRETVEQLGAEYIDSSHLDGSSALDRRFDFILSTVNARFDLNAYLRMLKPRGKLCVVAHPLEQTPISVELLYDISQRTIYGNYIGSRRDMVSMLTFAADHDIRSVVHVMPFTKVNEAIDMVRDGAVQRVVLQR